MSAIVYVDDARIPHRGMLMCHMVSESESALHSMADALGLKRSYYHRAHYNIGLGKRADALRLGAKPISQREAVKIRARLEGAPDLAETAAPFDWYAHLCRTFEENEKAFPDIMERYSMLLGEATNRIERTEIMRAGLRETIALRFPLAQRREVVAIDNRQGALAL